jgi:hypothetical protein
MPFSYRSGWLLALALIIIFTGIAQPSRHRDGTKRGHTTRYILIALGLALLTYTFYGCSTTDTLI